MVPPLFFPAQQVASPECLEVFQAPKALQTGRDPAEGRTQMDRNNPAGTFPRQVSEVAWRTPRSFPGFLTTELLTVLSMANRSRQGRDDQWCFLKQNSWK
ncbi:MAG: hypothetical protein OXC82_00660 [Rhodobacteraceae bacterium]|nr:hypothetical protein [Paracoccaceae bacterium]MCY4248938.1 hypothetical protein [Paracoccaceae bacterium]